MVALADTSVEDGAISAISSCVFTHRSLIRPTHPSLTAGHFNQFSCGSSILAIGDPLHDGRDRVVSGHAVDLGAVTETEAHRPGLHITIAGQQHKRHLLVGVV